jgi:hypothetical protein
MEEVNFIVKNCMDCPFHEVQRDPDPDDWFCDDDEKVLCTKINKYITVACRPYHKRQECNIPIWCPIKK